MYLGLGSCESACVLLLQSPYFIVELSLSPLMDIGNC